MSTIKVTHPHKTYAIHSGGRRGLTGPQGPDGAQGVPGEDGVVQSIVAGTNVTVDSTDPANPIVSASGGGGGGAVDSVNGQTGVVVLDQDDVGDGTTYKQYSGTDKTKLAGIETGAEVNNISDANATDLTDGGNTTLHNHDSRYYTEAETDTLLGNKQPLDADLTSWALITRAAGFDTFVATPSGANLASLMTTALPASKGGTGLTALSANIVSLLGAADYAAVRTLLSLVIGTNVQAWDADLDTWATKTAPSSTVVGTTDTQTLTNKRRQLRTVTVNAPGATPTTNTDNIDVAEFTGLNAAITSMTTNLSGTPVNNDFLEFKLVDDGTGRAITWGASFTASGTIALPTTTVASTVLRVLFQYSTTASLNKFVCVGVS